MPSCVIFTAAWHFFLSAWTVLSPACSLHGGQGWVAAVVGGLGGWSVRSSREQADCQDTEFTYLESTVIDTLVSPLVVKETFCNLVVNSKG